MTTPLRKALAREVVHSGVSYRVVVSADGLRVTPKGGRRGVALSWDDVLNGREEQSTKADNQASQLSDAVTKPSSRKLGMADVVAADVLILLQRANETLSDAAALIDRASELPSYSRLTESHPTLPRSKEPTGTSSPYSLSVKSRNCSAFQRVAHEHFRSRRSI